MKKLLCIVALLFGALLTGCASLPAPEPSTPTTALADPAQTQLGRIARDQLPPQSPPNVSGFRLLPEGETAFNARVALMRRAQKTIDAQYYSIGNDTVGQQFLRELRDAAQRGVRVRLLVDDLYTAGEDPLLTGLAAFPNVEVRLFNPIASRSTSFYWRIVSSLNDFSRINHRMHNKLFIADNAFSVSGGRNMADEYFMHSATANFIDLDVMSSGPVVRDLSAEFDRYWNSPHVYPVARIAASLPPADARKQFDETVARAGDLIGERPQDVLGNTPVAQQLDAGKMTQVFAPARVFVDSPDKVAGVDLSTEGPTVTNQTLALFAQAKESVSIVSPYFIPGERGMEMMKRAGATQENGRLLVITNSLGATDEPLVYAEYAKYRVAMLQAGVRIYEVAPTLRRTGPLMPNFGKSLSRLHAKVAVIDDRLSFIGSMNLDGRSALQNTEIGLVIDSADIATTLGSLARNSVTLDAWRLRLSPDGSKVEWLETEPDGRVKVHHVEPDDSVWLRLQFWLLLPFVNARQL